MAKGDESSQQFQISVPVCGGTVSAGGLGGTRTLALFVVREEDLVYDPAQPGPPVALIQSDLRSVLQHLRERGGRVAMNKGRSRLALTDESFTAKLLWHRSTRCGVQR